MSELTCWFCGLPAQQARGELFEWVMPETPMMQPFLAHEDCPRKNGIGGELIRRPAAKP
jgi:hypothetical protein